MRGEKMVWWIFFCSSSLLTVLVNAYEQQITPSIGYLSGSPTYSPTMEEIGEPSSVPGAVYVAEKSDLSNIEHLLGFSSTSPALEVVPECYPSTEVLNITMTSDSSHKHGIIYACSVLLILLACLF